MSQKPDPNFALLREAVNSADVARVRTTLLNICLKSEQALKEACDMLLVGREQAKSTEGPNRKRAYSGPKYEMCIYCDSEYNVLENGETACEAHEGELDVDDDADAWLDHDERCHGPYDTEEMRRINPKGFMWDCCEEAGDAEGCRVGPHQPKTKKVRRN